ncbi:MAG: cadherin-like domain-containing protein, partial [Acidimicrobiia bacterium]|nr:cadherin-like domain-containing protein [Acidimicrobiia bacterium]
NGQYLVDGLPAGEYFVEIDETTIPADLGTAPPVTVSLPGGGSDLTADFPLVGNRPPVAVDDEDVTDEDTPVVITVLDDDSDPDGHSFAISTTTDPTNGSIVVNPDGTITYTPNPGFVGVDTFTYTICELDGVVGGIPATGLCDTATVTVTIVEVNEPPGPEASFQSVVVGDPLSPMPVFDPDGGPVTVTYISGELPPGITLNPEGTFNGVTEEIGTYQVVVEVCDDDDPQICIIHTHTIAVTPLTLPGPGDDPDPDDPPDTLPFTGANFGDLLLAALMMLTAGATMVLYSRRRTWSVPPRSGGKVPQRRRPLG